jgi:hypothetical protein
MEFTRFGPAKERTNVTKQEDTMAIQQEGTAVIHEAEGGARVARLADFGLIITHETQPPNQLDGWGTTCNQLSFTIDFYVNGLFGGLTPAALARDLAVVEIDLRIYATNPKADGDELDAGPEIERAHLVLGLSRGQQLHDRQSVRWSAGDLDPYTGYWSIYRIDASVRGNPPPTGYIQNTTLDPSISHVGRCNARG